MDFDALIDQITTKVAARIAEVENSGSVKTGENQVCASPAKVLVLRESKDSRYALALKATGLSDCCQIDFAGTEESPCDVSQYEAVILFDLTVDNLAQIGAGLTSSPYTKLAVQAVLSGCKIFVPKEEVALFRYKDTAPEAYYQMLCGKLNLLAEAGVTFCPLNGLKNTIVEAGQVTAAVKKEVRSVASAAQKISCGAPVMTHTQWEITKRVATEKDVNEACMAGAACLLVSTRTIVTDLAKDRAKAQGLAILRK